MPQCMTFVFFRLMISLNAAQALEKRSRRACSSFSLCATRAASSAKRRSRSIHLRTLVLARSLAGLNNFPSERVRGRTLSTAKPKACFRRMEKKIMKSVGANTQPCLTPMLMSKASDELPSNLTVPRDPSWSFGGQPIRCKMSNRPSQLTMSKAFVRSIKAMKRGLCCSQHFSCSCLREKIISTVDRFGRKPH